MTVTVTGRDTRPPCPGCETTLAIHDDDTFACYNCMRWFSRLGPGEAGGEK